MEEKENSKNSSEDKVGLGVGIITRGWVSMKWMMHMERIKGTYPVGMFWKYLIVENRPWAEARTEVVHKAKAMNFEWLLFIDDDVFIPEDAVSRLFQAGKKIVTGMYWTKTDPPRLVIFKKIGDGPYDTFPVDELIKIGGSGLGCCLIHMSVFEEFDKHNIPYFLENWIYTDEKGTNMKCPVGEDHYFFINAQKLGFEAWCDTGVLCDHYDYKTRRFFPGEKVVRSITEKKLKDIGREDIVEEHKKKLGIDHSKKTVVFFNAAANPFCGNEIEKRGVGGSESAVINMSRILALRYGLNVHVFCKCSEPGIYDGVHYHDIESMSPGDVNAIGPDIFIMVRNVDAINRLIPEEVSANKVFLWAHDLAADPVWNGIDKAISKIDKILAVSNWHKKNISDRHNIPLDKFFIARNGVDRFNYKNKNIDKIPGKCVYSSTPFRGLDILLEVWPKIKDRVPHAELYIFSSMKVYGAAYDDSRYTSLYNTAKKLPGVHYFGSVKQDVLAKHYLEAELLTYPNTFEETACITAMEAQAAGTPIITSDKAALTETVPDSTGIRISGNPYSAEYKQKFIDSCVELLTNKDKWSQMHKSCLEQNNYWDTIAEEWFDNLIRGSEGGNVPLVNSPEYWDQVYSDEQTKFGDKDVRDDFERYDILLENIKEHDRVLDVGCGRGGFTRYVRQHFPENEIWGTDISHEAIDFCREKNRSIFYANHPIENAEFEGQYFDVITCQHVIEHYEDPKELIIKMRKLVKPNGKIILVIPINDDPWREHPKIWQMKDVYKLAVDNFPDKGLMVKHRHVKERKYKDGRPFEEAIVIVNMGGD
jgi:2-polyprenyl-3-methyl-5-hydroxy-6-metoxy-1,4-benzoquinol methylase